MEESSLTDKSRITRKCSSEDYPFFLPLALSCKDVHWQLLFRSPLNNGSSYHRNQIRQYFHWSHSCSSWIEELWCLKQAYNLYTQCLLCLGVCRWNSHVCSAPCGSRLSRSSTEVETSRQTYPWPYGQYDWRLAIVTCRLWLGRPCYVPLHLQISMGQAENSFRHYWLRSHLSCIQTSLIQTRSHPTCSNRHQWHYVALRSDDPSGVRSSPNLPRYDTSQQPSLRV